MSAYVIDNDGSAVRDEAPVSRSRRTAEVIEHLLGDRHWKFPVSEGFRIALDRGHTDVCMDRLRMVAAISPNPERRRRAQQIVIAVEVAVQR